MNKEIRWKQRFQNYEKSFLLLKEIFKIQNRSKAEKMGLIQAFEITFELSWKLMKDYLKEGGYNPKSPREVIKQSLQDNIITNGHTWMEALEDRNQTSHIYDEKLADLIENNIYQKYTSILEKLYYYFKNKKSE